MISEGLKITGDIPVKSGAYAEVWTGFHNETVVAIKSFRVHDRDEVRKILSVRLWRTSGFSHLNCNGFFLDGVKGNHGMETARTPVDTTILRYINILWAIYRHVLDVFGKHQRIL